MSAANHYLSHIREYQAARILMGLARGNACFDHHTYITYNNDLHHLAGDPHSLWMHFVYHGQFEDRPFR